MNLARILYPVQVLGPGKRIGLWLCGCSRACKGCSNPELWQQRPESEVTVDEVLSLIHRITSVHLADGFTISGGEPMDQASELAVLLREIHKTSDDILIYTGYRLEELRERYDERTDEVLTYSAVVIDGAYVEEKNDNVLLRGSSNQQIHIMNSAMEDRYKEYLSGAHNQIQNFTTSDGVVSVGIHDRNWKQYGGAQ